MTAAAVLPLRLYQLAVVVAAVSLGLVAGLDPRLALAAAAGMVFVVAVFANLALGFAIFTGAAFLEALPTFGPVSFPKIVGLLLALAWLGSITVQEHARREEAKMPLALLAPLLMLPAWALISALWAVEPGNAFDDAQRWALNLTLFPIALAALRLKLHLEWVFAVFVGGALLSVVLGYLGLMEDPDGLTAGEAGRLGGAGINSNQLGGLLVCATIFAAALAVMRARTVPARAIWLALSVVSAGLLAATLSRGAMFGLLVAFACAPFVVGPRRRLPAAILATLLAASLALTIVALVPDDAARRLSSSDNTGSGRTDIWRVGWRMVEDRPVLGVGAGNFQATTVKYLLQPGVLTRDEYILDRPKVAHNIYLQVLAELGVVGLVLFLWIVALALRRALRAAHAFSRAGDRDGEILARALLLALIGLLAADFFSSQLYSKQLWLLLATAVAIAPVAARAAEISSSPDAPGR